MFILIKLNHEICLFIPFQIMKIDRLSLYEKNKKEK